MESSKRPYKILLIEDNHDFVTILCSMFEIMGYKTAEAYNGIEGINKARDFLPDVILCDIGLPGMNGFEVAKSIREESSLKDVAMIAITGYTGQNDIDTALKSGFNRLLAKPIDITFLKKVLDEILL